MCIAFPGRIISIAEDRSAVIEISGTRREVCLDLVADELNPGDYVICHAGYALHRVDEALAEEQLALLKELMEYEVS